ncbi:hypothetical protein HUT19_15660 [Streptomyces sp. NA02950]|uniref:hypothetical protein n=1 Tax=Streptomyces sp. NA02950 TaxID=2742137 RepID=UPI00159083E5|nr:hypothetical protein [Streptomyces sp. NA02950]QKV93015.1 hypothetical protein HUT19_15660 [Streptomyces sp. NA02950]
MPDDLFGDRVPRAARTKTARRRAGETDLRTISQRITDVAHFEDLYILAETLTPDPGPRRGRPPHYPPYLYLLFLALRGIHGSARYCAGDLQDPSVWAAIRAGVAHHLGADEAARLPDAGPSRHQWQHAQRTLLIPRLEELSETFADLALAQALRQGLLPAGQRRTWSSPQRHQLIAGDGTVAKSPTLATTPYSVDPTTGEIRRHRVDPASSWQKEGRTDRNGTPPQTQPPSTATDTDTDTDTDTANNTEGAMVLGTKFVVFSTRHRGYFRRVFLRYAHVPHNHPSGEGAVALDLACAIIDAADGCMGVLYDGALRGMHRDVIARRGRLLINKQHKGTIPRYIRTLAFDHCRHELWSNSGRVHERAPLDDGTSALIPLPVDKLERRASPHTHRWYHLLDIPCPRGPHQHRESVGITSTPAEHNRGQSDTETGFHRAEHLLQIPDNTAVHQSLYGGREDTEAGFSQLDRSLWNRRMIAFGAQAQSLVVLGFLLAQNATSAARYQEDPTYSDAHTETTDPSSDRRKPPRS